MLTLADFINSNFEFHSQKSSLCNVELQKGSALFEKIHKTICEPKLKYNGIENMCITGLCEPSTDVRRVKSLIYGK